MRKIFSSWNSELKSGVKERSVDLVFIHAEKFSRKASYLLEWQSELPEARLPGQMVACAFLLYGRNGSVGKMFASNVRMFWFVSLYEKLFAFQLLGPLLLLFQL